MTSSPAWKPFVTSLVTLLAVGALELLRSTPFGLPTPTPILATLVILSAYAGGLWPGLLSALVATLYTAWVFVLAVTPPAGGEITRVLLWALAYPGMVMMVGLLKRRAEVAGYMERENAVLQASLAERRRAEAALRSSEGRFRTVFEASPLGIALVDIATQRLTATNQAFQAMLGYADDELTRLTVSDITHPDDLMLEAPAVRATLAGQSRQYSMDKRYRCKDGRYLWANVTAALLPAEPGQPQLAIGLVQDITERKRAESEASERQRFLSRLNALTRVALQADDLDGLLQTLAARMAGLLEADAAGFLLWDEARQVLVPAAATEPYAESFRQVTFAPGSSRVIETVLEMRRALAIDDLQHHAILEASARAQIPVRSVLVLPLTVGARRLGVAMAGYADPRRFLDDDLARGEQAAGQIALAIAKTQLLAEVRQLAMTDALTGLYNRRGLAQLGGREVERARRLGRPLSVLMLDIDHFKLVNDQHGHAVGDEVLRAIAAACQAGVREIDLVARYGGEEIVLLLAETDLAAAENIAERLRLTIAGAPVQAGSQAVQIGRAHV